MRDSLPLSCSPHWGMLTLASLAARLATSVTMEPMRVSEFRLFSDGLLSPLKEANIPAAL